MNEQELDREKVPQRSVYIKTFGCQMNEYDSEKMIAGLGASYRRVSEADQADVVLINTCSVREKGEHKLYGLLGRMQELKDARPGLVVGVGGCVAQQEGKQILKRSRAVDFVVGTHNISLVPSLVKAAQEGQRGAVAVDYREEWEDLPIDFDSAPIALERQESFGSAYNKSVRALVAIQRGCSKHCSFCVVPTTRGEEVSRSAEEILREISLKARLGAKEVMLLGQTVNSYGRDLTPRVPFHQLVQRVSEISGIERIRFTSPHPAEVRNEFIELFSTVPQLCPHIHMPLQSGSDRILKLMNRNYRRARYLEIIKALKEKVPDIAISTDVIVGFPTETEEDFQETLSVMEEVGFLASYAFKYSERPNTTAAIDFSETDQVAADIQSDRLTRLLRLQDKIAYETHNKMVGRVVPVLVEHDAKIPGRVIGRIPQNTRIEVAGGGLSAGDTVMVTIMRATPYGLYGESVTGGSISL